MKVYLLQNFEYIVNLKIILLFRKNIHLNVRSYFTRKHYSLGYINIHSLTRIAQIFSKLEHIYDLSHLKICLENVIISRFFETHFEIQMKSFKINEFVQSS